MTLHISGLFDSFLGRGKFAVTVPIMDGPLRPNQLLESAPVIAEVPDADNLVAAPGGILLSSGKRVVKFNTAASPQLIEVHQAPSDITSLAHDGSHALAIGLSSGGVVIAGGNHDGKMLDASKLSCPTACAFVDPNTLIVANGSTRHPFSDWKRDLMSRGRSGSIHRLDLRTGKSACLADGLAFPYGLASAEHGRVFATEAWSHRIIAVPTAGGGKYEVVLDELPAYPARLHRATGGGYWLTLFAARSQIFEFVLAERRYCEQMMATIEPEYWVAPALATGDSYLEPMQGGGLKQMGIMKPWAPPRSYGLVVRCDEQMRPLASYHSRADGRHHGITSIADTQDRIVVTARGRGYLLDLGAQLKEGEGSNGAAA